MSSGEKILIDHGRDMYRLGLEYALVMIDVARITETDLKQILKDKIQREFGVKKIEVTQIKSYYPLGTTDGISYTVRPRI